MALQCPHCRQALSLPSTKPGSYTASCTHCHRRFALAIPNDPNGVPIARALPEATDEVAAQPPKQPGAVAVDPFDRLLDTALGLEQPPEEPEASPPVRVMPVPARVARPATPTADGNGHGAARQASAQQAPTMPPPADTDQATAAPHPPPRRGVPTLAEAIAEAERAMRHSGGSSTRVYRRQPSSAAPPTGAASSPGSGTVHRDAPAAHATSTPSVAPPTVPPPFPSAAPTPAIALSAPGHGSASIDYAPVLTGRLGGYEVVEKLGSGGMGAVYLAKQLSLDRNVALKILHPRFADDPQFIVRFTREAYAAAQLNHHNIVQVHDLGSERGMRYFSMEFVDGPTLSEIVSRDGKLDPEVAAGYVLQAARGLEFAHERGMIHRDIKPGNLLLNGQGLVKVADLGLVKTPQAASPQPGSPGAPTADARAGGAAGGMVAAAATAAPTVTEAQVVMGTPAYMAPEQVRDSGRVDQRADIYSLGCTFYDLVTGHPPFQGRTAAEVMTKQLSEPVTPPQRLTPNVPERLSAIIMKMLAKQPDERYASLSEVVRDLEGYLGLESGGRFSASDEHTRLVRAEALAFNHAPLARFRVNAILGFFGTCALLAVAAASMGTHMWLYALGIATFGGMAGLSYFLLNGFMERTYIFARVREYLNGAGVGFWARWVLLIAMLLLGLMAMGWLSIFLLLAAAGVATSVLLYSSLDRLVAAQRHPHVAKVQDLVKELRGRGVEENAIRHMVCRHAGTDWEELYEWLFGYEAKVEARARWGRGERGAARHRFRPWRDWIVAWIDARQRRRRIERERRYLQSVEARALRARGVSDVEARKRAQRIAQVMIERATDLRITAFSSIGTIGAIGATAAGVGGQTVPFTAPPRNPFEGIEDEAEAPARARRRLEDYRRESYVGRMYGGPLGLIFGPHARFVYAVVLLLPFLLWLYQNHVPQNLAEQGSAQVQHAQDVGGQLVGYERSESGAAGNANYSDSGAAIPLPQAPTRPLRLRGVPDDIAYYFGTFNAGVAGLLLLISSIMGGVRLGYVLVPACALIFAGHLLPLPDSAPILSGFAQARMHDFLYPVTMTVGTVIALFGFVFAREPR